MPRRYYSSTAARTTLSSSCNNSDTTLSVTAVSGWPSSFPYTLIIDQDTINEEVVNVTARTGTTLTVERGQDGTTAVSHSAGASVNHGVSARDFNEPNQFLNEGGTVTGPTLVSANSASTALEVRQTGAGLALRVEDETNPDATPVVVDAAGDLGVGTATPDARLVVVESGSQAAVRITNTGTGNSLVVEDSANPDSSPFVIDASGRVGIGTSSPSTANPDASLDVYRSTESNLLVRGDAGTQVLVRRSSTDGSGANLNLDKARGTDASKSVVSSGDTLGRLQFRGYDGSAFQGAADIFVSVDGTPGASDMPGAMIFRTAADGTTTLTERMRITNAGRVGIGTTAPTALLHVEQDAALNPRFAQNTDDTAGLTLQIAKRRGTAASPTIVSSGDTLGNIVYYGHDGSSLRGAAAVTAVVDGTPGASDMPGALLFWTTPDGSATLTERMRITSAGNVGIGTSSPAGTIHVSSTGTGFFDRYSATSSSSMALRLRKSASGTVGTNALTDSGNNLGAIVFSGNDGSGFVDVASILATIDASAGSGDMPSALSFFTTADGAATSTERMKINNAGLITGSGTSLGAWTAYTPTLGGTGWAIGNGAFSATYCQIGKCVIFKAQFTAGSTTTFGSDSPTITLPITSLGTARAAQTVTGWFLDASAGSIYQAAPFYNSTTTVSLRTLGASGLHTTTTATVPFAWDAATGDVIRVSGIYEIA